MGIIKVKNIAKNGMNSSGETDNSVYIIICGFIFRVQAKEKGYKKGKIILDLVLGEAF